MTIIPNLNLVIQQTYAVIKAKNALHPALDATAISSAYQPKKEEIIRTSVQETEEKEKITFDKRHSRKEKKKKDSKEEENGAKESSSSLKIKNRGKILNTVA